MCQSICAHSDETAFLATMAKYILNIFFAVILCQEYPEEVRCTIVAKEAASRFVLPKFVFRPIWSNDLDHSRT